MDVYNGVRPGLLAGRREWTGLAVLALPTLLLSIDLSVLYLALPHLSSDLGASATQQLWIMDVYAFMLAGLLVTMGTLGDRIGRRSLLMIGAAAFGVASVAAAYSASPEMLIATRAVMGIAGATLMPSTLALISNMFHDPGQRGVAIGVWMSCFMGGMAFGPVVGGAMLQFFWWGSVFLLGVPIMVMLLLAAPALLPEYRSTDPGRLDLWSVVLSMAAILPVVYGLKEFANTGWQVQPAVILVVGLLLGAVFVNRQRRLSIPLVDVRLFTRRAFSSALGLHLLVGAIQGGTLLLVSLYLQMVVGLSPLAAGLWLVPTALATMAGAMVAPAVARRVRPAYVIAIGLGISVVGYVALTQVSGDGELPVVIAGFALVMLGVGPTGALATGLIVGSAPPEKAGSAAALAETGGELGIALGIATLGSVGAAVYRGQLMPTMPEGVPGDVAESARESITGAVSGAEGLSSPLDIELLATSRDAFATGLTTVAVLGAALFVLLTLAAVITLRDVKPNDEQEEVRPDEEESNGEPRGSGVDAKERGATDTPFAHETGVDPGTPSGPAGNPDRHSSEEC